MCNPSGSVKDRAALSMVNDAEAKGLLKPGKTLVEYSSGNLGISLAMICASKGYHCIIVTHGAQSREKLRILKLLGATVKVGFPLLPDTHPGHPHSIVKRILESNPDAVYLNQYENRMNPLAHYASTGREIYEQTSGKVRHVVCSVGSGGTISGIGKFLKEKDQKIKTIGVDPEGSILRSRFYGTAPPTPTQGFVEAIGQFDFVPATFWNESVDEMITVTAKESMEMAKRLAREEGILAGWSSGAALAGALKYAGSSNISGLIVVILPDGADRYLQRFFSWRFQMGTGILPMNAKDILSRKKSPDQLISVRSWDSVGDTLRTMISFGVSHVLVKDDSGIVGKVEKEKVIGVLENDSLSAALNIIKYMEKPYPTLDASSTALDVINCLGESNCVVITRETVPIGILSKTDLAEFGLTFADASY